MRTWYEIRSWDSRGRDDDHVWTLRDDQAQREYGPQEWAEILAGNNPHVRAKKLFEVPA